MQRPQDESDEVYEDEEKDVEVECSESEEVSLALVFLRMGLRTFWVFSMVEAPAFSGGVFAFLFSRLLLKSPVVVLSSS